MTSRKAGSARKRSRKLVHHSQKAAKRLRVIEQLERRDLFTGTPWEMSPAAGLDRPIEIQPWIAEGEGAEGLDSNPFNTNEAESNDLLGTANYLPLGTGNGQRAVVNVGGSLSVNVANGTSDVDYYAFDLRAGDIFDVRALTQNGLVSPIDVSLQNSRGTEMIASNVPSGFVSLPANPRTAFYPLSSPLFTDGSASFAVVIPTTGRYHLRVESSVALSLNYSLNLRTYRPVLENTPVGTKQILYVDFNGEFLSRSIFNSGVLGTARLSPLSSFLPNWGLQASDENRVIDALLAELTENLTDLGLKGNNGYFPNSGIAGHTDFLILNSRDHADPWGQPNVSRLIVGGTQAELGIPTIGIAESVDIGNFDTTETAVVLLDVMSNPAADPGSANSVPLSGSATRIDAIRKVVGWTMAHEFGHLTGGRHTLNTNGLVQLLDTGGQTAVIKSGAGPDGILGTPDDVDRDFASDTYDPVGSGLPFGIQDTINSLAFGLSSGTIGAFVSGLNFNDINRNGRQDSGEAGLAGWTVFVDSNNDGLLTAGEPRGITATDGRYFFSVPAGTLNIRAVPMTNWRATTPSTGVQSITVAVGETKSNINFGFFLPQAGATGFKWNDLNANGVRDTGEPPIEGVFIYLDLDGDDRPDLGEPSTKTAADGSYSLTPPTAGTYAIREVLEPGFLQTFPAGGEHVVTFDGTNPLRGYDFGNRLAFDYGDAPPQYPVTLAQNGARAGIVAGLSLGASVDIDTDGQPNATATGDDIAGLLDINGAVIDDEDGVVPSSPIALGFTDNTFSVTLRNTTGQTAYLNGWIDFNGDGDWDDANEQIYTNQVLVVGTADYAFTTPALNTATNVVPRSTFARFRLSQDLNTKPTGSSNGGEVEDHRVEIAATRNFAIDDTRTVSRNTSLPIEVLLNDFKRPGETLEVVSVSPISTQGGNVTITNSQLVTYSPPRNFVGRDTFTYRMKNSRNEFYTATVTVDVILSFANPVAVDDSYDVASNTVAFPLNVLANDIEGQNGALQIVDFTPPSQGGTVVLGSGNQSLRYTPPRTATFNGFESFTYTAADGAGNRTTATVTLHSIPIDRTDDVVEISVRFVNEAGAPITAISQGSKYRVQIMVDALNVLQEPGVYAAYLDLLYDAALTGPATGSSQPNFNFPVEFFNNYFNGRRGTSDIPGKIDDFGAFLSSLTPISPRNAGPIVLAELTFDALAPGRVTFVADPADSAPFTDVLLTSSTSTPIPTQQVRYGRSSIEIVGNSFEFPFAVDDFQTVTATSTSNPIRVLDNDSKGSTGVIRIVDFPSVTQAGGSVVLRTNGNSNPADDFLEYTPPLLAPATDQFTYTIRDDRGFSSVGTVTVQVGTTTANDRVRLRLDATDLNGNPIDQVTVGQKFQLRGFVRDLRSVSTGVFAAFQDILYRGPVSIDPRIATQGNNLGFAVEFDTNYGSAPSGSVATQGLINEIGSVRPSQTPPSPPGEKLHFKITLTATGVGTAVFQGDPADISPFHDTLLYGDSSAVPIDQIDYLSDTITIVAAGTNVNVGGEGFTNAANRFDVSGDGFVSPIDALLVINSLNSGGARSLVGGEGEQGDKFYYDVNADGFLSPIDALQVINHLNEIGVAGAGEGESEGEEPVDNDDFIDAIASDVLEQWNTKRKR